MLKHAGANLSKLTFQSLQDIFVYAMCIPFTNYHASGGLVPSGGFCVRDMRTISPTTKWGTFWFLRRFSCSAMYVPFHQLPSGDFPVFSRKFCVHIVHFISLPSGDFLVSSGDFRVHDVCTVLTNNSRACLGSPQLC